MRYLTSRQQTNGLFILAAGIMFLVTAASFFHFYSFQESLRGVMRSQDVLQRLSILISGMQDAETGQRGFLLTGRPEYLEPFTKGSQSSAHEFAELEHMLATDEEQHRSLSELRGLADGKFKELRLTIELAQNHRREDAIKRILRGEGKRLMDGIRAKAESMRRHERLVFEINNRRLANRTSQRLWFMLGGGFVSLMLLLVMYYLLLQEIHHRARNELALQNSEHLLQRQAAELRATNQELQAFSYSVSHDLRAPLRGIEGFSRVVLEKYAPLLDEEGKGYLERVRSGVKRMGQLIDDLLNLSRITRATMAIEPVNLAEIARNAANDIQEIQPERKVEWIIPPTLPAAGDSRLLRAALDNLLGNAWKFTSGREKAVIEVGQVESPQGPVFFIRDNGAGFDMAYKDKLFNAFQRLHSTDEFPGTGIGLATVQRIVRRHGGHAWAEASVDVGATFYFTLGRSHES